MAFHVSLNLDNNDTLYWGETSLGTFSIKSLVKLQRTNLDQNEDKIWKMIWRVEVPQRIVTYM